MQSPPGRIDCSTLQANYAQFTNRLKMNGLRYNCAGMARRDFLQLGLGAVMGLGFSDLLRYRASAAQAAGQVSAKQVNCILIWMDGGSNVS